MRSLLLTFSEQLLVGALLGHNTSINDSHLLRSLHGGQAVRDDQHSAPGLNTLKCLLY